MKFSLSIVVIFFLGCGRKETPPNASIKDLVNSDLEALSHLNSDSLAQYDEHSNHRFSEIFGGTRGENVVHFIQERIKYFLIQSDISRIEPRPRHIQWQRMPAAKKDILVLAQNIGTSTWLQGLIDRTSPILHLSTGQTISITSSRVGVILLGPGYKAEVPAENNTSTRLNPLYRQGVLVHEARHSDCTGGISEPDLQIFRAASSYEHAVPMAHSKACGHLHRLCASGIYKNLAACDSEPWGAYSIHALFLEAVAGEYKEGSYNWEINQAALMDIRSRIPSHFHKMLHHSKIHPDLSSSGLR